MDALSSAVSFCRLKFLLKKDQIHAVNDYLKGRDMVVNLPTGYGKRLCYALCPLITDNCHGVTRKEQRSILVLISPLKALMDDQILSLYQLGLSYLPLTPDIFEKCTRRLRGGDFQVAILSPESFECVVIRTALRSAKEWIYCIAIDEAHYIEQCYFMMIIFYYKCLFFCYYFCRFVQADSI